MFSLRKQLEPKRLYRVESCAIVGNSENSSIMETFSFKEAEVKF